MKNPNLSQLLFLLHNETDLPLSSLLDEEYFLVHFIEHLSELFGKSNHIFRILEPLLDPALEKEQQTVLSLDEVEVGELHLICHSFFDDASLVYYSPSGLLELYIMEFEQYEEYQLSDYLLLLNEFASVLIGEKTLYEKIKNHGFE